MAELFIQDHNSNSGRVVTFEEDGSGAWLYLSSKSGNEIESDAFAYSIIPPLNELNKEEIKKGKPPILFKAIASDNAVLLNVKAKDIAFVWSKNGNSVALLHFNKPIAMILHGERFGYSKALIKDSPFGNVWNADKYDSKFK